MPASYTRLFCLSALFGAGVVLAGCGAEEDPPPVSTGGGSGNVSATGGSSSSTTNGDGDGDTSDTSGIMTGDGDGDTMGDGDGDGDTSLTTTMGDGDGDGTMTGPTGDGDGDGDIVYQECEDWQDAGFDCGLSSDDLVASYEFCEATMENAMAEGGDCVPATLDYWQCRTTLMCGQFLVDGPGMCEETSGAATTCTGWPG